MRKLLFFAVLISSCSARYTPTDESVSIKKETKKMLESKVGMMAGAKRGNLTYYFIMNENNTFSAIIDMDGTRQYDFCAGTFQNNSDTLSLSYYKNYKSKFLTDKAVINSANKEIVFIDDKDPSKNTMIKILNEL